MEEKTLYVSDLDGTLMHKDLKISDFSVKTINALVEKGVAFTYATARSISSAGTITKDLKLNLPVITRNGAVLADNNTGKIIEKALFTEKEVEMLKEMLPELPKTGFVSCYFGDDMKKVFAGSLHTAELQGYLDYYKDDPSVVTVSALSEMFMGNPGYVTIIGNKDETEPLYLRRTAQKQNPYSNLKKSMDLISLLFSEIPQMILRCLRLPMRPMRYLTPLMN